MVSRTLAFFFLLAAVAAFERFDPPSNTNVKHICVDNPDLPACGPDFCQKNPEAAGCKKSRNFFAATCFTKPNHPGCRRNAYMDKFIAWKIQKDCEINPHGPFCPKTLGKKACKKDSSSSSSEENPAREDQELATVDKTRGKKISITGRIFDWFSKAADKFRELSREAAERKRYEEFVKNLKTRNGIKVFSGIVGHQGGYTL